MTNSSQTVERPKPSVGLDSSSWRLAEADAGRELAVVLAVHLCLSEREATDLIRFGSVHIGRRRAEDPTRTVAAGETVTVHWPWQGTRRFYELDPARILYRDSHLLAYDKEPGIATQQTPADAYNNLYTALLRYLRDCGVAPPHAALHHRLDRDTSGVILFSLDPRVDLRLGRAFEQRQIVKDYLAWVTGRPSRQSWCEDRDIGRRAGRYQVFPRGQGKSAETAFTLLAEAEDRALLRARPATGRTHQIRLHLAAAGHPVLGDRRYGGDPAPRLMLHAYRLRLGHPASGAPLTVTAPVPSDWPQPHLVELPDD